ncbi:hypothetical protein BJY52DRAFT_923443 [Lactarius psammicola]|nr:hypothetical protein BJY52DRAFT_923443 [Lactarius psammicola]
MLRRNNGVSGFNFGPSQFQNLPHLAGYDPMHPLFSALCSSDTDRGLPYLGHVRNGEASRSRDHPQRLRTILLMLFHSGRFVVDDLWMGRLRDVEVCWDITTLPAVGVSFAWLGVEDPSRWRNGVVLCVLGRFLFLLLHLNACTRCFCDLVSARMTIPIFESLARNRVSNITFPISSTGETVILSIMARIIKALGADARAENNTKAFSLLIAFSGGV